jgi:transcription antitermination factor NusG
MESVTRHIIESELNATNMHAIKYLQQKKWYAIFTRPRYEKRVYEQLQKQGIEAYLPLQITIRQWSDRKKKVSEPLFSCYLFVNITLKDYYRVLNTDGVVRYIAFEGKAVSIPENQIRLIQNLLTMDYDISETMQFLPQGTRVAIKAGPLIGIIGELVEYAGRKRVIIRIDEICKSIWVNVPLHFLSLVD